MNARAPEIGEIVEVDRGWYRHHGLFYGFRNGVPLVLANIPGGVRLQSWAEFSNGRQVRIVGYPSALPTWQVLARAQNAMGRQYSWLSWNCEHFVNHAHSVKVESTQVNGWLMLAGMLGVAATLSQA